MAVLRSLALVLRMGQQVLFQIDKLRIGLEADRTTVRLDSVVDHLMLLQVGALGERLVAVAALVRLLATVQELVLEHIGVLREGFITNRTMERLEAVMDEVVALQIGQLREPFVADVAHVGPDVAVRLDVLPETGLGGECFPANVA